VYFAIDFVYRGHGPKGLRTLLDGLKGGLGDKKAVEQAVGMPFPAFEKAWLAHVRKQPFPKELIPLEEKVVLKEDAGQKATKDKHGPEVNFGEFANMEEPEARRDAHLGELFRERGRVRAAAEAWGRAHKRVGSKYERLSNRYARALADTGHEDEAELVLNASLKTHPGIAATHVQLGRIRLKRSDWGGARAAYLEALSQDPFDPEIHFALARTSRELGDEKLATRAVDAAVLLSGMERAKVEEFLTQPIPR
jgi:tetratricopeptide (TPR) repeat protein